MGGNKQLPGLPMPLILMGSTCKPGDGVAFLDGGLHVGEIQESLRVWKFILEIRRFASARYLSC